MKPHTKLENYKCMYRLFESKQLPCITLKCQFAVALPVGGLWFKYRTRETTAKSVRAEDGHLEHENGPTRNPLKLIAFFNKHTSNEHPPKRKTTETNKTKNSNKNCAIRLKLKKTAKKRPTGKNNY